MKAVILAGGRGTRISEETYLKPKPMVEIGGRPILWHVMKIYSAHGINDFIICIMDMPEGLLPWQFGGVNAAPRPVRRVLQPEENTLQLVF